jgi:hypothetical protein
VSFKFASNFNDSLLLSSTFADFGTTKSTKGPGAERVLSPEQADRIDANPTALEGRFKAPDFV